MFVRNHETEEYASQYHEYETRSTGQMLEWRPASPPSPPSTSNSTNKQVPGVGAAGANVHLLLHSLPRTPDLDYNRILIMFIF